MHYLSKNSKAFNMYYQITPAKSRYLLIFPLLRVWEYWFPHSFTNDFNAFFKKQGLGQSVFKL